MAVPSDEQAVSGPIGGGHARSPHEEVEAVRARARPFAAAARSAHRAVEVVLLRGARPFAATARSGQPRAGAGQLGRWRARGSGPTCGSHPCQPSAAPSQREPSRCGATLERRRGGNARGLVVAVCAVERAGRVWARPEDRASRMLLPQALLAASSSMSHFSHLRYRHGQNASTRAHLGAVNTSLGSNAKPGSAGSSATSMASIGRSPAGGVHAGPALPGCDGRGGVHAGTIGSAQAACTRNWYARPDAPRPPSTGDQHRGDSAARSRRTPPRVDASGCLTVRPGVAPVGAGLGGTGRRACRRAGRPEGPQAGPRVAARPRSLR